MPHIWGRFISPSLRHLQPPNKFWITINVKTFQREQINQGIGTADVNKITGRWEQ